MTQLKIDMYLNCLDVAVKLPNWLYGKASLIRFFMNRVVATLEKALG